MKEGEPFGIGVTKYSGEKLYEAKARGALAEEGGKREEESELLKTQFNLTQDENGKYKELRGEVEEKYRAAQAGKELLDDGRKESEKSREAVWKKAQEAEEKTRRQQESWRRGQTNF